MIHFSFAKSLAKDATLTVSTAEKTEIFRILDTVNPFESSGKVNVTCKCSPRNKPALRHDTIRHRQWVQVLQSHIGSATTSSVKT